MRETRCTPMRSFLVQAAEIAGTRLMASATVSTAGILMIVETSVRNTAKHMSAYSRENPVDSMMFLMSSVSTIPVSGMMDAPIVTGIAITRISRMV